MPEQDPFGYTAPALTVVRAEDPAVNRFQTTLLAALNSYLRNLFGQLNVVPKVDLKSLPPAGAKYSRRLICVSDTNRPEEIYVCLRKSNGTYEWARIATASS